ncbi:hypothetical protein CsatA_013120 [Cannabis sativa]
MVHFFSAKMSILSLKVHPSKFIIPRCTNQFPFVHTDFKPQLEPETMDSKAEELPTNLNYGNPIACHGRSPQRIWIDLVGDLKGPPQADKEFQGRLAWMQMKEVGVISIRESNQPKKQTYARRLLHRPLSSTEEFPEAGKKISASGNEIF